MFIRKVSTFRFTEVYGLLENIYRWTCNNYDIWLGYEA